MTRLTLVTLGGALFLLTLNAGVAVAAGPPAQQAAPGAGQTAEQSNDSVQDASSAAVTAQGGAQNTNISVRVLSPGDDGSVSQQNNASARSSAANGNASGQAAKQNQVGGGPGTQTVGQSNQNAQEATSAAVAEQRGAENKNVSVRLLSPGDNGSVSQQNNVDASSSATNASSTTQAAGQEQAGATGSQAVGQSNEGAQEANSGAVATQGGARNTNVSVRVLSPGNTGDVSQENTSSTSSQAQNGNTSTQAAGQEQSAGPGTEATGAAPGARPVTTPKVRKKSGRQEAKKPTAQTPSPRSRQRTPPRRIARPKEAVKHLAGGPMRRAPASARGAAGPGRPGVAVREDIRTTSSRRGVADKR
jgi:GTP cyclohydrolase II